MKRLTFLSKDLITERIKEIVENNKEFEHSKFFSTRNFYIITNIKFPPEELEEYKMAIEGRTKARILKRYQYYKIVKRTEMPCLQRDEAGIRYERNIELLNGEEAHTLIGFYERRKS